MKLTPEARAGLEAFCDRHDIPDLTALLEAIGLHLAEGDHADMLDVAERARAIHQERARRPGPRKRRY